MRHSLLWERRVVEHHWKDRAKRQFDHWAAEYDRSVLQKYLFAPAHNALLEEVAAWALMPLYSFIFSMPGLHAQTKMLLGSPLVFQRTPKIVRGPKGDEGLVTESERRIA